MSLQDAAVFLASQWPVFPCNALKKPVVENGFYAATKDIEAARALFRRPGAALIGVPTGAGSDLVVVDFDIKRGVDGLAFLRDNEHRLPRTRRHRTASGGVHLLFRHPGGIIRNSASGLAPGVDVRGDGGYIIVPPSEGYEITDEAMPADMPGWLVAAIMSVRSKPEPVAPATYEPRPLLTNDGTPWGLGALRRACDAIRNAPEGAKHDTLNREAYSIGGLVTGGDLLEGPARAALADALGAIRHRCDDFRAAERTLMQAFAAGMEKPRQPPPAMPERRQPFAEAFARVALDDTGTTYDAETGEIIDAPPRTPRAGSLPVIYFADVQPNLDAADFVEGLLIEGAMSVIYGPSNCGKTFFMTDLALHVASGQKWRGKEIEAGGVIYCALEGAHGISNRIAAFKKEHGLEGKALPFAIVPVSINLLDPNADRVRLVETIKAAAEAMGCPVKLIVIDTLSRALAGGNENAPDDMGAVVASADFIRQTAKAHLAFIHHSGKDQAQGARGHSLLRAATDTEIEISRPDSDSPSVARVTKQRELEIEGTFAFTLKTVELGTNRRGKPVTSCVVDPVDASAVQAGKARLSNGAAAALTALHHALIEAGQLGTDSTMPGARVVHLDVWRREFYARSHLETQEARKKAFQRAVKDLRDGQAVGVMNDFAWDAMGQNDRDK